MNIKKYCCKIQKDNLTIYAVLDKVAKTFKWSLFKDGNMIDCGDLSNVAQTSPEDFLESFSAPMFRTFTNIISVEVDEFDKL